jgi:ABC-type sugar transport system permease subunit
MKKTVQVYGLIAGLVVATLMLISTSIHCANGDFDNGMIYGYGIMILSFSLIFVAIKNYRDKFNGGLISFGKAFKIGLFITLVASTIYVIAWQIDYRFFVPDFMDKYTVYMLDKLRASGASQAEISKQALEMAKMSEMYKNPLFNILLTYVEIVPVGLVVSLISALVLKRKTPKQQVPAFS